MISPLHSLMALLHPPSYHIFTPVRRSDNHRWTLNPISIMSGVGLCLISEPLLSDWRGRSPTCCQTWDQTFYQHFHFHACLNLFWYSGHCIAVNEKLAVFIFPRPQNKCTGFVNPFLQNEGPAGSWNPTGTVYMCCVDRQFPAPPHLSADMWGELYKYRVLRKNSPVLSVSDARFCDALVLTSSSSSASSTTSTFFNINWERVSWLFFRL